jgi:hypothetical protein
MQDDKGYANTPAILCHFITFLASALPLRSVPTFIELVVGAMITRAGFVTEAWLAISPLAPLDSLLQMAAAGTLVLGETGPTDDTAGGDLLPAAGLLFDNR